MRRLRNYINENTINSEGMDKLLVHLTTISELIDYNFGNLHDGGFFSAFYKDNDFRETRAKFCNHIDAQYFFREEVEGPCKFYELISEKELAKYAVEFQHNKYDPIAVVIKCSNEIHEDHRYGQINLTKICKSLDHQDFDPDFDNRNYLFYLSPDNYMFHVAKNNIVNVWNFSGEFEDLKYGLNSRLDFLEPTQQFLVKIDPELISAIDNPTFKTQEFVLNKDKMLVDRIHNLDPKLAEKYGFIKNLKRTGLFR